MRSTRPCSTWTRRCRSPGIRAFSPERTPPARRRRLEGTRLLPPQHWPVAVGQCRLRARARIDHGWSSSTQRSDDDRAELASIQTNWAYVKALGGFYRDGLSLAAARSALRERFELRRQAGHLPQHLGRGVPLPAAVPQSVGRLHGGRAHLRPASRTAPGSAPSTSSRRSACSRPTWTISSCNCNRPPPHGWPSLRRTGACARPRTRGASRRHLPRVVHPGVPFGVEPGGPHPRFRLSRSTRQGCAGSPKESTRAG